MTLTNGKVISCGLCDSSKLTPGLTHGMRRCLRCGALNVEEHTQAPPVPDFRDLPAITREDADHLLDLLAAEGIGRDRSQGR
jgi:hypothetical protein